jgi:hypothetical protein
MKIVPKTGIVVASVLLSFACSSEPQGAADDGNARIDEPTGQLSLELVAADSAGQSYRLRNAIFDITSGYYPYPGYGGAAGSTGGSGPGQEAVTVSSETDPDEPTIRTRLSPGSYYVSLHDPGWSLERLTPSGPEPVEESVLLSDATQYVYVYDRSISQVNYTFGVDGTRIDFRYGDLDIGITIERPGDQPPGTGGAGTGGVPNAGGAAGAIGTGGVSQF